MKPVIGINLDIKEGPPAEGAIGLSYPEAISKAGGLPVLIPPMDRADLNILLASVNGIMLIGGRDYSPECYGDTCGTNVSLINKQRENFDLLLINMALETNLPILGICAGCQLLNIARGGTLIQDIPSQKPSDVHHTKPADFKEAYYKHPVEIAPDTKLSRIYTKTKFDVPTSHHQAVKTLGKGLKASAFAQDGIIEAIEFESRDDVIGIQWHPERDYQTNKELFEFFVSQCGKSLKEFAKR
jgi:putative glutamine amidotransferase